MTENLPQEPNPEIVEAEIKELLDRLHGHANCYDELEQSDKDYWDWFEMEADAGGDRPKVKRQLEAFVDYLDKKF
jgi:hypothetical protein